MGGLRPARLTLRSCVLALAFACAVAAWGPAAADARGDGLDGAERGLIHAINRVRASHGLPGLRASAALSRAANRHSRDMARGWFFGHDSANGRSAASRVRAFAHARRVGETLAYVPARSGGAAARVVDMWMRSAPHRAVLMSRGFSRVGIGRVVRRGTAFYTADFSSRR